MSVVQAQDIANYYDSVVLSRLQGFITENIRIERALDTLISNVPRAARILEIGCGIGHISKRLQEHYQNSEVYGLDISPKSIEIANALFRSDKVQFHTGELANFTETKPFDLVVMIDVFEHIAPEQRTEFACRLKQLLNGNSFVFLSCPSPEFQAWLKIHRPEIMQPIDEDITESMIAGLADMTGTRLHLYKSVSVWFTGDYFHVVLGPRHVIEELTEKESKPPNFLERIKGGTASKQKAARAQRLQLVRSKLGETVAAQLKVE